MKTQTTITIVKQVRRYQQHQNLPCFKFSVKETNEQIKEEQREGISHISKLIMRAFEFTSNKNVLINDF